MSSFKLSDFLGHLQFGLERKHRMVRITFKTFELLSIMHPLEHLYLGFEAVSFQAKAVNFGIGPFCSKLIFCQLE